MPVTPTFPGIYIEELASSTHTITAAPTSIAVFIGYTHPFKTRAFGTPVRLFSFSDYERAFGGFFSSTFYDTTGGAATPPFGSTAHAVNQFFLNGGSECYVLGLPRSDPNDPAAPPFSPSSKTVGGIKFTSREPTDVGHELNITVDNVHPGGSSSPPTDLADVTIVYGQGSGEVVEKFRQVSLDPGPAAKPNPNFIETRIGTAKAPKSSLVTVGGPYIAFTQERTTDATPPGVGHAPPDASFFHLATDYDAAFKTNGPLDKLSIFNLLILPGITANGILSTAVSFCERKMAFLIIDPPANVSADDSGTLPSIESFMEGGTAPPREKNGAIYFPYVQSTDPVTGDPIELPPSGTVAGVFAKTDTNRGVWKAPAGLETTVLNVTGVVERGRMTDPQHGVLNQIAVNCLRDFRDVGTVVFGARTLVGADANTSQQQWKYVPVRRTALFLEQTLYRALTWVVFEPNDEPLWTAIRTSIEAFMLGLFRQGAFQGSKPSDAFQVKCDHQTTTQADVDNGIVNIVVAFAPLKPAEFVIVKIAQLAGQTQTA